MDCVGNLFRRSDGLEQIESLRWGMKGRSCATAPLPDNILRCLQLASGLGPPGSGLCKSENREG